MSISMPAGDSTSQPGFDGDIYSDTGNAWVPKGRSVWEMSCQEQVGAKANSDFLKRVDSYPPELREATTYVAVTARKWRGKKAWQTTMAGKALWRDVRAYDADDLEDWLEQTPAVAIEFLESLGMGGPGVESLGLYWKSWTEQSSPAISMSAILSSRTDLASQLAASVQRGIEGGASDPITLQSDSIEEGVAFAAAAILGDEALSGSAIAITSLDGWRFVAKNEGVRVAVVTRPELAAAPVIRTGLAVVIPFAVGDTPSLPLTDRSEHQQASFRLDRPTHSQFEQALIAIGIDQNDARRLTLNCGRSWTTFRRSHAKNPAIRNPTWLAHPSSRTLSIVCLLGGWNSRAPADRAFVERVAGRSMESVERDLAELSVVDDAPVIRIGGVWKAKSPLELLSAFGGRLTDMDFERFFAAAKDVLETADPQLELPDEERYAAAIHDKVRKESDLLMRSILDTLIKLSVRAVEIPSLSESMLGDRVSHLVASLLDEADRTRWLSLATYLPALAEASPNSFLSAVERSLARPDCPVGELIRETSDAGGFGGRCWHAGLLWALETLGWAPQRLAKVSIILADLEQIPGGGNWANTASASLVSLFRSWFPQTAATVAQRIEVLDLLAERRPDAAFGLLGSLLKIGHDVASHTHRPRWRDDDAGAGQGATRGERNKVLQACAKRLIAMAEGNPIRVGKLVDKLAMLDGDLLGQALSTLVRIGQTLEDDEQRSTLRDILRRKIHWHLNYDDADDAEHKLKPLTDAYAALEPADLAFRHAWLFKSGWPDLPIRASRQEQREAEIATAWCVGAVTEVFERVGWEGLERLALVSGGGWNVGRCIPEHLMPSDDAAAWVTSQVSANIGDGDIEQLAGALLHRQGSPTVLEHVLSILGSNPNLEQLVRILVLAPENEQTWQFAEKFGVAEKYWAKCRGEIWRRSGFELSFELAISKLVAAKRPRTAFAILHGDFSAISADVLALILEQILLGDEPNVPLQDSYHFGQAIKHIEQAADFPRDRLIRLEFAILPLLGYFRQHEASVLNQAVMSDPTMFAEVISLAFRPRTGERPELDAGQQAAAERAWHLLNECEVQPGTNESGETDTKTFSEFVVATQEICRANDRIDVCNISLGEIIARGPTGADGVFPFEPARPVLDADENAKMLQGFHTGCFNKRGVVSRSMDDGGAQERDLSATYRGHSVAPATSFPRLSAALEGLAQTYDRHAVREDIDARLRMEEP